VITHILHEKPDIHDTYALTTSHMRQPFVLTQQSWTESLLSRKKAPVLIHITMADRSTGHHPVSLPQTAIEAVEKTNHLLTNMIHWFTDLISLACDQYIQYLLTGATHRSLTDIDEGYYLEGVGFTYHSPRPYLPMIFHIPLMALSGLKLSSSIRSLQQLSV
jgi:hypothetical protein